MLKGRNLVFVNIDSGFSRINLIPLFSSLDKQFISLELDSLETFTDVMQFLNQLLFLTFQPSNKRFLDMILFG